MEVTIVLLILASLLGFWALMRYAFRPYNKEELEVEEGVELIDDKKELLEHTHTPFQKE